MTIVYHWSKQSGLTETSPEYAGTGIKGAESDREQVKGTYFGESDYREYAVQSKPFKYRAELDYSRVYDLESDPLGLIVTAQRNAQVSGSNARYEFEKLVFALDFLGYRAQSVIKVFHNVTVERC